jgi:membrane protein
VSCAATLHPKVVMSLGNLKRALVRTYQEILENHTLHMAAGLSYYFVLALFPALIFLSATLAYWPVPGMMNDGLTALARFVPPDTMTIIYKLLATTMTPNRGTFLSLGGLGLLWTASGGTSAMIEALNMAYEVEEDRPFWKTRLLAIALAAVIGALLLAALSVMIVGPEFGKWLAMRIDMSALFVFLWPFIHWIVAIAFTVVAVEILYLWAPNVKLKFRETLPGALLAVGIWIGLSFLLGVYFRHLANFNKTYGTLGAGIALMVWLYWTGFAILSGAELNGELAKIVANGKASLEQSALPYKMDSAA